MEIQTAAAAPVRQLINSINKIIELQAKNLELIADGKPVEKPVAPKDWELVLKIIDKMPNFTQFEKIANGENIVPTQSNSTEPEEIQEPETKTKVEGNFYEHRLNSAKDKVNGNSRQTDTD